MSDDVERIRRKLRGCREFEDEFPDPQLLPLVNIEDAAALLDAYDREVERRRDLEREVGALRSDAEFRSMRDWLAEARKELTAMEWRLAREAERRKAAEAYAQAVLESGSANVLRHARVREAAQAWQRIREGAPDHD